MQSNLVQQLPLKLTLQEGKDFHSYVTAEKSDLIPLLVAMADGNNEQLYLHGCDSCGKSHLLEACVRRAESRGNRAWMVSCSELVELSPAVLGSIGNEMDLLAFDDVGALAGDEAWEEGLFHLYNWAKQQQVALLFSGRWPPAQAGFQLPDLRSRLAAGPVLRLPYPDEAGLMRMFRLHAAKRGLAIDDSLLQFLVARAPRQPARLIDILDRLDQAAMSDKRRLTIPFVKQTLGW